MRRSEWARPDASRPESKRKCRHKSAAKTTLPAAFDAPYSQVMSHDLFDAASPAPESYNASQIEVLEGLEPVRRRPGMYIGGTDERALHHLAAEVIDNSMDEAVAGHANRIEVTLDVGNRLTVTDNGRGIPIDPSRPSWAKAGTAAVLAARRARRDKVFIISSTF